MGATDVDKVEILGKALDVLDAGAPDRSLVLATLCSELAHGSSLERRQALAEDALAVAESSGDDAIVVRVLNHLYVPLQVPALLALSLARTTEALERAERAGDPALLFWAAMWRAESAARAGDIETMDRCIEIQASTAHLLNQPMFAWAHTFFLGLRAQLAGDTDRAEELATAALQIGTDGGQLDAEVIFGAQLMIVSGQRGTMSDLVPLIEQLAAGTPDISQWLFGSLLAKAHVEGGRTDEARSLLEAFAASGFDLPLDQVWLTGMVDYAEAAIECRDPEYVASAVRPAQSVGRPASLPPVHRLSGRSATTSAASPRCSVVTTTPRPTSSRPPNSAIGWAPNSFSPGPDSGGGGCSSIASAPATPRGPVYLLDRSSRCSRGTRVRGRGAAGRRSKTAVGRLGAVVAAEANLSSSIWAARQTVEVVDDHRVNLTGGDAFQQPLILGTHNPSRRRRQVVVCVFAGNTPASVGAQLPTVLLLAGDPESVSVPV